jgi:hypothetical protein
MLGVVGYLVNKACIYRPEDIDYYDSKFSDLGSGLDASFAVTVAGVLQVLGFLELADITRGEFVGDFRNDGLRPWLGLFR